MLSLTTLLFITAPLQQAPVPPVAPVESVRPAILQELRQLGYVGSPQAGTVGSFGYRTSETGTMGVQIGNVREVIDGTQTESVAIIGVLPGSAAEKAGLVAQDQIVAIAGKPVSTVQSLTAALKGKKPGEQVKVVVRRGNETKTLTFPLGGAQGRPVSGKRMRLELDEEGQEGGDKLILREGQISLVDGEGKHIVIDGENIMIDGKNIVIDGESNVKRWVIERDGEAHGGAADVEIHRFFTGQNGETSNFAIDPKDPRAARRSHGSHRVETDGEGHVLRWDISGDGGAADVEVHNFFTGPDGEVQEFKFDLDGIEGLARLQELHGGHLLESLGDLGGDLEELLQGIAAEEGPEIMELLGEFLNEGSDSEHEFEIFFEDMQDNAEEWSDHFEEMGEQLEEQFEGFAEHFSERAEGLEERFEVRMERFGERMERRAEDLERRMEHFQARRGDASERQNVQQQWQAEAQQHMREAQQHQREAQEQMREAQEQVREQTRELHEIHEQSRASSAEREAHARHEASRLDPRERESKGMHAEIEALRAENKALHNKIDTLTDQVASLVKLLESQQSGGEL